MARSYSDILEKNDCVGIGSASLIYNISPGIVVKTIRSQRSDIEEHPLRRNPALIARWIQQLTSALEYIEKMGFSHNDVHPRNCLLDKDSNMKLSDFDSATTIGQFLETSYAPWARIIPTGPLKDTHGLCGARTEQFAVGTLLYFMAYGCEPYEDIDLRNEDPGELDRRFQDMEFPEVNRHDVFDSLILACWHNVYPTMALLAYDFKRKTKDIASIAECSSIDRGKERQTCEALIRGGLLGPDLAFRFQPAWQRYLHSIVEKSMSIWKVLVNIPKRLWACVLP